VDDVKMICYKGIKHSTDAKMKKEMGFPSIMTISKSVFRIYFGSKPNRSSVELESE